jgi:hypothetical protein
MQCGSRNEVEIIELTGAAPRISSSAAPESLRIIDPAQTLEKSSSFRNSVPFRREADVSSSLPARGAVARLLDRVLVRGSALAGE